MNRTIDVSDFLENRKFSRLQLKIAILCGLTVALDSFDAQTLGFIAPGLSKEWSLPAGAMGPAFGASLFGTMIGALLFGVLADKFGRKWLVILGMLIFGAGSIMTAFAGSFTSLMVIRFVTGIGLGGVLPNAIALTGEYASKRRRPLTIMLMFALAGVGTAIGAVLSSKLLEWYDWRSIVWLGGIMPIAVAFALCILLPESIYFLVARRSRSAEVRAILSKIDPQARLEGDAEFVLAEEQGTGFLVPYLFRNGRALVTCLIWGVFFLSLLEFYFMHTWLPTLIHDAGLGVKEAIAVSAALQLGGALGTVALGLGVDRLGFYRILVPTYAVGFLAIAFIGWAENTIAVLLPAVFVAGTCLIGGQIGINALAASFYPTFVRSTGVGWALGFRRIGSILGPVVAGIMLASQWSVKSLFYASAFPALAASLILLAMAAVSFERTRKDKIAAVPGTA
jgi:MFS transporter, AAHS family, 4-hydroxybenzoate transporter